MTEEREERIDRLVEELHMENWDSYGGEPLTKESAALAKTVLPCIPPDIQAIPTSSGGFAFEWMDENGKARNVEVWAEP